MLLPLVDLSRKVEGDSVRRVGKPRKRVSVSCEEGFSITPKKLRYVQFILNSNIVVFFNHKKEPLCSYHNRLVTSSCIRLNT